MSSHREAPEISKDPAADNTDVYAFVSPDQPDTVTLIANYLPFQNPQGGPNFYEFGDDVLYEIHVSNAGDAKADVTYQFRFQTKIRNPKTFLYNTGPITSLDDPDWNRPQTYSVTRVAKGKSVLVGRGLTVPPVNVGVRSTPNYQNLAAQAIHRLPGGRRVFAGQRAEGFFVDLGSIFDLAGLRPFNPAHLIPLAAAPGVNGTQGLNVHSIALQVPISDLTRDGKRPQDVADPAAVIGVWASASRRAVTIRGDRAGNPVEVGPYVQVSRLGNPLFNEVIVPMSRKDEWNATDPTRTALCPVRRAARARRAAAGALPRGLPQPRGVQQAQGRPVGHPAHRHTGRHHPRVPELHRDHPGGPAAPQRRGPTCQLPQPAGAGRW